MYSCVHSGFSVPCALHFIPLVDLISAFRMRDLDNPDHITPVSPCVGYCTTVLGDDVCRSCLRTFDEVTHWVGMTDAERIRVNQRIACEQSRIEK